MNIPGLEGSRFQHTGAEHNKDIERMALEQQMADFQNNGGTVEAIPRGVSGNTYSPRPLTGKQSREKFKQAVANKTLKGKRNDQ